jgi:hypothetical protein
MQNEYQYISIKEILSRILRHPLLKEVTLEQAASYVVDFIGIFGFPKMYEDKEELVQIKEYRGTLPCDLISIIQVKDCKSGICLRSMTDSFSPHKHSVDSHIDLTFKTQGRIIITSIKDGEVLVAYKSIPVDQDGFPMLLNLPTYLKALELYIKKEVFTILFDQNKLGGKGSYSNNAIYQNTMQQYAWAAGQLQSEMTIPSIAEMESIKGMWNTLLPRTEEFANGFEHLGDREIIKAQ